MTPSALGRRLAQPVEVVEVAAPDLDPAGRELARRGVGAREADDLVAGGEQLGDDGRTDVTGRAGDEDAHGEPPR